MLQLDLWRDGDAGVRECGTWSARETGDRRAPGQRHARLIDPSDLGWTVTHVLCLSDVDKQTKKE